MRWREVSVKAGQEAVEAVSEILIDGGAGGVVIEDPAAIKEQIAANIWDAFEFPEELLTRDFVRVTAYFPCDRKLEVRINQITARLSSLKREYIPDSIKDLSFAEVREEDWADSWKAYYKPVYAGDRIVIKPSWESHDPKPGEMVLELDPGMAFGTGTHPTTVMCIKFLEKIIKGGETVFDIGTGSGILAIAAARLGAGRVRAVDIDEVAVKVARANVVLNGVDNTVEVMAGNLLDRISGQTDVLVANIVTDAVIRICPAAARTVRPGGEFIASGIVAPRAEEVRRKVEEAGFVVAEVTREGDWAALTATRKD